MSGLIEFKPPRFIEFKRFKTFDSFFELLEFLKISSDLLLVDSKDIDRDDSIIIFISHRALIFTQEDGPLNDPINNAHDNSNNDKFRLLNEALVKITSILAPNISNCYIWMDCICNNCSSDSSSAEKPNHPLIFQMSDIILTPLYDSDVENINSKDEKYEARYFITNKK